jgi:hypothetical protein
MGTKRPEGDLVKSLAAIVAGLFVGGAVGAATATFCAVIQSF